MPKDKLRLCTVKTKEGQTVPAQIVSQRSTEKSTEYYVHYLDQDRRLDAWIDASSVILTTTVPSEKMNGVKAVTSTPAPAQDRLAQEHLSVTRIRNVENVVLGQYEITTWYYSPYPEEYHDCKRLYVCDGCLRYMKSMDTLSLHKRTCGQMHPPGEKIYEKGSLRVWRVDGAVDKLYCQCLSLLGKLFIDHKTLFYDVDLFTFYVLTEADTASIDCIVGLFSREKISYDDYNLATIITFPPFQRRQYGRLMIELSYALRKQSGEGPGTPERPLSDLGLKGYLSYWRMLVLQDLSKLKAQSKQDGDLPPSTVVTFTIQELADRVFLRAEDVILTLSHLGLLDKRWSAEVDADNADMEGFNSDSLDTIVISQNSIINCISKNHVKVYRLLGDEYFVQ